MDKLIKYEAASGSVCKWSESCFSERVASPGVSSSIVSNKLSSSKIIASFSRVDMSSLPRAIFHGAKNTAPTPPAVLPCSGDDLLT